MKLLDGHLAAVHQFVPQRSDLEPSEHVSSLVEGLIVTGERSTHFGGGVVPLVAHPVH